METIEKLKKELERLKEDDDMLKHILFTLREDNPYKKTNITLAIQCWMETRGIEVNKTTFAKYYKRYQRLFAPVKFV